jgi:hypothetical protein
MIFTRVVVSAVASVAIVAGMGAGGPDPGRAVGAQRLVAQRSHAADAALETLGEALAAPLELARDGATRTATGTEPPGPALSAAGEALAAAEPLADRARAAVVALDNARHAATPAAPRLAAPIEDGELAALGAAIGALAPAADGFADLRVRAERLTSVLADALDAVEAGDLARAESLVAAARDDHERLATWESGLDALPVWLATMERLLAATETLLAAVAAGDADGALAASGAVSDIGSEATTADRALRIAFSEGAAAVVEGPPVRVAELVRRVEAARAAVATILHAVGR